MKKNILFVDDEPNILQGFRRMLRGMRGEWEMYFVESGLEAIETLSKESTDVMVTDMRMPGMDGMTLLKEVKNHYPDVVRIILSGHSDKEMVLKSSMLAHQYLSKPCDADTLKSTINRASNLRELLAQDSLKRIVSQIESLPSLQSLYTEIMELMESPDSSIKEVAKIIEKDLGMTAKILQLANSAFFGVPRHISSPAQAVNLLGLDTVKALVVTVGIFSRFEKTRSPHLNIEEIMDHSLRTGSISKELAKSEGMEDHVVDYAFLAGLLHDVGKIILAANMPDTYEEVFGLMDSQGMDLYEAERKSLGTNHAEVGAYLMGLWGLPDPIVEAIVFHHTPGECFATGFSPLTAVHVANAMEHWQNNTTEQDNNIPGLDYDYLEEQGLKEKVSEWQEICIKIKKREESNE